MTQALNSAVQFANWCNNHSVKPQDAARLYERARKAHRAGVRYANGADFVPFKPDAAMLRFEKAAQALGFTTEWNGLWPTLHKDGREVRLPDLGL